MSDKLKKQIVFGAGACTFGVALAIFDQVLDNIKVPKLSKVAFGVGSFYLSIAAGEAMRGVAKNFIEKHT